MIQIHFTRHAQRRLQLYGIDKKDISDAIEQSERDQGQSEETKEIVIVELARKYKYPIKIIYRRTPIN